MGLEFVGEEEEGRVVEGREVEKVWDAREEWVEDGDVREEEVVDILKACDGGEGGPARERVC